MVVDGVYGRRDLTGTPHCCLTLVDAIKGVLEDTTCFVDSFSATSATAKTSV